MILAYLDRVVVLSKSCTRSTLRHHDLNCSSSAAKMVCPL
uniref:Uncharacterized protein n=1 Tax=Anguilla anguilla TaxID=7936 RepID=A0A0E9RUK9_ANGAN